MVIRYLLYIDPFELDNQDYYKNTMIEEEFISESLMETEETELIADWDRLQHIFISPENEETKVVLVKYMEQILFGLHDFLKKHVGISEEISLKKLANDFKSSLIKRNPQKKLADVIQAIIEDIAPHAVNVASPYFIGHMTSAIPFFMIHLHAIVAALNQNLVKLETSKVVSVLEKQVIAKVHRLIYHENEAFYRQHIQNPNSTLGVFASGGTLANVTALWVARNTFFKAKAGFSGIEAEGISAAYRAYDIERSVILVSQLGHYSLWKIGGVLGIGNKNVLPIEVGSNNTINVDKLQSTIKMLQKHQKTKVLAVVGVAGATETGTIDPLPTMAEICAEQDIHFHVDAAWGGPTLLSDKYRHLLTGIEQADSVTIDGHKQFYMPMGCGMVYFKDPYILENIAYHAAYVNRVGSVDLGIHSLEGSRPAHSLILNSAFEIMGGRGYALLIDHGIEIAREFAKEIQRRPLFQLITPPQLNILTYSLFPEYISRHWDTADAQQRKTMIQEMDRINCVVQRLQREAGKSFVSRTTLKRPAYLGGDRGVLRSVIMNPMTNMDIIREILDEQENIYHTLEQQSFDSIIPLNTALKG